MNLYKNTIKLSFVLVLALSPVILQADYPVKKIRAEILEWEKDVNRNNANLDTSINIKSVDTKNNPYFKNLEQRIMQNQFAVEQQKRYEYLAVDAKWKNEAFKEHAEALAGQQAQVIELNYWARTTYNDLLQNALKGDPFAMYRYAWYLSPYDDEKVYWLQLASNAGHGGATATLAWLDFNKAVNTIRPRYTYMQAGWDYTLAPRYFKSAVELFKKAAAQDDPSALYMSAIISWAGSDEDGAELKADKKQALTYLNRLEEIGCITLYDILKPMLYDPSFFQLVFSKDLYPRPYAVVNSYVLLDSGGYVGDSMSYNFLGDYAMYSPDGMYKNSHLNLEMIRAETYPTLWTTRYLASKGDKKAQERLLNWGNQKAFETGLDKDFDQYNYWSMQSNLPPTVNRYGLPKKKIRDNEKFLNPYNFGFYMNEREKNYWLSKK